MINRETVKHSFDVIPELLALFDSIPELEDSTTRRDYFSRLSSDDFIDILQLLDGHLRGESSMQPFDGQTVFLEGIQVMDQRDKEAWLRLSWDIARSFLEDNSLDDQQALDYAGITVAGATVLIHPFIDSNGRSSRILSHMIMRGVPTEKALEGILTSNAEGTNWYVVPFTRQSGRNFKNWQPDSIVWHAPDADVDDIISGNQRNAADPAIKDTFDGQFSNDFNRDDIIREFIEFYPPIAEQTYDASLRTEGETSTLHALTFLHELAQSPDTATAMFSAKALGQLQRFVSHTSTRAFLHGMVDDTMYTMPEWLTQVEPNQSSLVPQEVSILRKQKAATYGDALRYAHYTYSTYYS
ncbi:MAG TPA: hypothetical protein PL051_03725 [Candidatus Saccharibacteria bacterium]|nr:hypothetical protein [Candidatus Saccharibacteria bacterium]